MSDPEARTAVEIEEREQEEDEHLWEAAAAAGETPDSATRDMLGLVHKAIDRFPDLAKRYRGFAGTAAVVSGALIVLAGIAVARRVRQGENPERILQELTSAEIESAAAVEHQERRRLRPRPWQRLRRARPGRLEKEEKAQDAAPPEG